MAEENLKIHIYIEIKQYNLFWKNKWAKRKSKENQKIR